MLNRNFLIFIFFALALTGCKTDSSEPVEVAPMVLKNVPAQRLNYRFETDVPAPEIEAGNEQIDERNEAVQADFDKNRPQEVLDRTITSPNKLRVLAVYRMLNDLVSEFRLDMYSSDGVLLKKITHDEMAVHFPGTIVWSPDSNDVAFIAMVRGGRQPARVDEKKENTPTPTPIPSESNSNTEVSDSPKNESTGPAKDVLTFRTEQIYICNSEGQDVKPLTNSEGLMYFYVVWAPDSSAIIALASPFTEWRIREFQMAKAGERFVPSGRPRLVEKNGRERLLDDYPTSVHPVWSPDSSKVAIAFDKQIRIYDVNLEAPTQAAIPLRNQLLLAAKSYEDKLRKEEEANANVDSAENSNSNVDSNSANENVSSSSNSLSSGNENGNTNTNVSGPKTTLPSASSLVSFNPIIDLKWAQDSMIYLETGYVKNFVDNEAEDRSSYLRWHRLILSSQAIQTPVAK